MDGVDIGVGVTLGFLVDLGVLDGAGVGSGKGVPVCGGRVSAGVPCTFKDGSWPSNTRWMHASPGLMVKSP